ncbi:helix-turn-helix domain-containing protein [Methylophaga sp.]|uniref:helix-turn-helix domain-containing protein n=1 Tax=Methylophaga sp. TaxID=2024840 RepID=UPI0014009386|nr:helix-turn-helix domain-containing protein [Methylophaga sp.]MTI64480.1 helix-turn-helix domain-containing protein [Methylophaga sp.]
MNQPVSHAMDLPTTHLGGERFCTELQPVSQRLAWLREIIGREYANVEITPPGDMYLYNDMFIYPWQQGVRLSPIYSNAITLERLPCEPEHISQDCYFAVLLTAGQYKLEQGGREVFLKPGEMTIYDATEPHRITIPAQFAKVLISIPRQLLDERVSNVSRLTATRIPSSSGIGAVTSTMIRSTVAQLPKLSHSAFQSLSDPVLDSFSLSIRETAGQRVHLSRSQGATLWRLKQFISHNLADSELDASKIAAAVGLSLRYINKLFEQEQTSLMRFVTQQRLARCRHYLASCLHAHLSITEIAMQAGFNNMAHFSRVFRQHYGMSPRAYRQQQLKRH